MRARVVMSDERFSNVFRASDSTREDSSIVSRSLCDDNRNVCSFQVRADVGNACICSRGERGRWVRWAFTEGLD